MSPQNAALKSHKPRYQEAVVTAEQFKDGATHPSVEKTKAELAVAQKIVESRGWEREIASAESDVNQAQANLNTAQKLVEAKSWEREIEIAKAAVKQATEQLKLAQEQLDDATIKSPIAGVIATQHLSVGRIMRNSSQHLQRNRCSPSSPVDVLKAEWHMPAGDASRINNGDLVLISTNAGIRNIVGTVTFISPTVNRDNNTVLVHATVPNSQNSLKPGTDYLLSPSKRVVRKNVQLLPLHAVLNIQNGSGTIFVVEGNVAGTKQVNIGGVYGGEIEVTSQLARGTSVIIDNQHRLQDGTSVSIAKN